MSQNSIAAYERSTMADAASKVANSQPARREAAPPPQEPPAPKPPANPAPQPANLGKKLDILA